MVRQNFRTFEVKPLNELGQQICQMPDCRDVCEKFKNGNFRKYCNSHNSYEFWRLRDWGTFKLRYKASACLRCGSKEKLEVDHILAIVNGGGEFDEKNLQTLCHSCHVKKTKKDLAQRSKGNARIE